MRAVILTLLICLSAAGAINAQDTSLPAMMSQHAYDSTIRALKKASTIKKDTVKQVEKAPDSIHAGGVGVVPPQHTDTAAKASVGIKIVTRKDTIKADTSKKHKIRYRPTGYLMASYGETYPKGDFKLSSNPTQGGDFVITAAFPGITSHLGMIVEFEYGYNRFDKLRYFDTVINRAADPFFHATESPSKSFYNHESFLLGFYYTYPIKRFSIDARILGGVMFATIPGETINISDISDGNNFTVDTYTTSGRAFALDEGISVRYLATTALSVSLGIDNLSAPTVYIFSGNGIGNNAGGYAYQTPVQINTVILPVHLFVVNLGVGYTINAKH